jgi:hypothetical protein
MFFFSTGEKHEKYRELRAKEQQIDEFLQSYELNNRDELIHIQELQRTIERILLVIAKNYEQLVGPQHKFNLKIIIIKNI